jgi:uncharacterized protein with PIN domain
MKTARFVFSPNLVPLLKRDLRVEPVELPFRGPQSAKHLVESLGIPHTEVGQLTANHQDIGLDYIVQNGDRIEVRGVKAESLPTEPRFVLDGHLGRLASHLRMLGLDCLYHNGYKDKELVQISVEGGRILLTRDRLLLMHKVITQGYLLRSLDPTEQLYEVVERYDLFAWVKPFKRCLRCNHPLKAVEKETVLNRLEPLTKKYYHEFKLCPSCNQIYWKGSHYERMLQVINKITQKSK